MKKSILLAFCLLVLLSGCSSSRLQLDLQDQSGTVKLKISTDFPNEIRIQTIMPGIDMAIKGYELRGTGPQGEMITRTITLTTGSSAQVSIDKLQPGKWVFFVEAKNTNGDVLGQGGTEVQIEAGKKANTSITVSPPEGPGELKVNVSWTKKALAAPIVEGTLFNQAEGSNTDITFLPGEDGNSASYENTDLATGNYILAIRLKDGDREVWSFREAVLILSGQTSEGNYHVDLDSVFEDFNDGTAGNFVDDASGRWAVVDGEYVLTIEQKGDWLYSYYDTDFSDFTLSVDLVQTSGEAGGMCGVYFRSSDGNVRNGYSFGITVNGKWYLGKCEGMIFRQINEPGGYTMPVSEHINTGLNAVNNVKIVCSGPTITIYINGHYIYTIDDYDYDKGKIGLQGSTDAYWDGDETLYVFKFDNFSIIPHE